MLIIIEGADCTGKTTLAKKLIKTIGEEHVSLLSKGPPALSDPVMEYIWPLSGYIPNTKQHFICDRWHIGEMIYPNIFHRRSIMSIRDFMVIDNAIRALGALIVYLEPPINMVQEHFTKRGDKFIKDIKTLNDSYFDFHRFVTNKYNLRYDPYIVRLSNVEFNEDLINAIINDAKKNEQGAVI
jgi:thymidylate kinase